MTKIVMVGSGGCMRELVWQIQESNKISMDWDVVGYTDNVAPLNGEYIMVGKQQIPYLGKDEVLLATERKVNVVVAVGDSRLRRKIVENLRTNKNIQFPNIILRSAKICDDVEMGQGCIISMDAKVSTNVKMGNFTFLNTGSMLCHDDNVEDFVTISPYVKIAGQVKVKSYTEIGMNASIIQGLHIGEHVTVGAGAVVIRDVEDECTVVGVPARKVKGKI